VISREITEKYAVSIDYFRESENYRPKVIRQLLIGEAPPPSKKAYFYVPPERCKSRLPIEKDRSLPATIFHHYFQRTRETKEEYQALLRRLQEIGVFLLDICDEPIKVRNCPDGVERIKKEIPKLRGKMAARGIDVADRDVVFLLPRMNYFKHLRRAFPDSKYIRWIDFRLSRRTAGAE